MSGGVSRVRIGPLAKSATQQVFGRGPHRGTVGSHRPLCSHLIKYHTDLRCAATEHSARTLSIRRLLSLHHESSPTIQRQRPERFQKVAARPSARPQTDKQGRGRLRSYRTRGMQQV